MPCNAMAHKTSHYHNTNSDMHLNFTLFCSPCVTMLDSNELLCLFCNANSLDQLEKKPTRPEKIT